MKNIRRNITAIAIFDFILSALAFFELYYSTTHPSVSHFHGISLLLLSVEAALLLICGIGILLRNNLARLLHYPLVLVLLFSSAPLGIAFAILVLFFMSRKDTKDFFNKKRK